MVGRRERERERKREIERVGERRRWRGRGRERERARERVRDATLFHTHALVEARISVPPPFERESVVAADTAAIRTVDYRGTSLIRKCNHLGPYRRPMLKVLGGWAFSYG